MSSNRDFLAIICLGAIALLCFPLLGLLLGDVAPPSIAAVSATSSPTPAPRVYLLPFRQIFAIGQTQPITRTPFLLYENGTDVFQVIGQQGEFARLQTLDGKMNFWTMAENVSATPPIPAQYDFSGRDKTMRLVPSTGYACLHEEAPPPVFSTCQLLPNFATAKLIAKITSGPILVYLGEIDGKSYFLPPEIVLTLP